MNRGQLGHGGNTRCPRRQERRGAESRIRWNRMRRREGQRGRQSARLQEGVAERNKGAEARF